jgi:DNA-binding transcriptional LysR family regulator
VAVVAHAITATGGPGSSAGDGGRLGGVRSRLLDGPVLLAVPPALTAARGLVPNEVVALGDYAREPWLVPRRAESCHEMIQRACGAAGFVPDSVAEASDFAVLTALVEAGAGVALVPRMALPDGPLAVGVHPLREPVTRTVFALTGPGAARRPDIARTLDMLAAAAATVSGGPAGHGRNP